MRRFFSSVPVRATAPPRAAALAKDGTAFTIAPYRATVWRSTEPSRRAVVGGIRGTAAGTAGRSGFGVVSRIACATATPPCPSSAAWWIFE